MAILRHLRVPVAVAAVTVAMGCDRDDPTIPSASRGPVTVQAILRAGDDTVRVAITQTRFSLFGTRLAPVSGAEVWIHGPHASVALRETGPELVACLWAPPGAPTEPPDDDVAGGCYVGVLPAAIQPGERYGLSITLPDGNMVEGETFVPKPGTVTLEAGGRVVLPPAGPGLGWPVGVDLAWSRDSDAVALQFDLQRSVPYAADKVIEGGACSVAYTFEPSRTRAAAGTGELQVYRVHCIRQVDPDDPNRYEPIAWDSVKTAVYVVAENPEYGYFTDYLLFEEAMPLPKASAGIRGAVGVFGAVTVTGVPIVFVQDDP